MANFSTALSKLLEVEGGYANDPVDKGGETIYGISRKNWPQWEGWKYVDRKNYNTAYRYVEDFYKRNFWNPVGGDDILDQALAEKVFDIAVNAGIGTATKIVQRCLNILNGASLKVDGACGPATRREIQKCKYPKTLLKMITCLQGYHYISICERDPSQRRFIRGWIDKRI